MIVQMIVNTLEFKYFCKNITKRPGWNSTNVTFHPLCKQSTTLICTWILMTVSDECLFSCALGGGMSTHWPFTDLILDNFVAFLNILILNMVWCVLVIDQRIWTMNTITTSQGGKGNVSFAHGLKMLDHFSPLTCSSHSIFFESDAHFWSGSALTP